MSDLGDVVVRLARLSDADIAVVVARATADRPGLLQLRTCAEVLSAATAPQRPEPARRAHPSIPAAPEIAPPISFSLANDARRVRDRVERPRHAELEAIRQSLRRTIRPDR